MDTTTQKILSQLGCGRSVDAICSQLGWSQDEFSDWWKATCRSRDTASRSDCDAPVSENFRIHRDANGIPRITAATDQDLFIGFGYAIAQDRMFQLDSLRRRALGTLSEVLGNSAFESDLVARTVGIHRIAQAEWDHLPTDTRKLLQAFSVGVNQYLETCGERRAIEFDLLDYQPAPWTPIDSLAIAVEFRWYLTGRFPVIVIPEIARRVLGDGPLYQAFMAAEADSESILHSGDYPTNNASTNRQRSVQPVGFSVNDPQAGHGSNNWVVAGDRTASGKPLLASDPHIAFGAVSCWYEVHLDGGTFNVAGISYAGMPAVMFGRNEHVAWGITNNICSLRDLYQERVSPEHPGCFEFDGTWEPWRVLVETIQVKGEQPRVIPVRLSRNGPIVDDILPPVARETGPVSLRWMGMSPCGWLTSLLTMDRATNGAELREAIRGWGVPTFSVVYADVDGNIGYQCTGHIPVRSVSERGYRPGWEPQHQWQGVIPFEELPHLENPPRGWIGTANNRVASDDFPYPLSGTWSNGYRGQRLREMLIELPKANWEDMRKMHLDTVSVRAADCVPTLLRQLAEDPDGVVRDLLDVLATWDFRVEPDRVGATLFNVFFQRWCQRIAEERFTPEAAALLSGACGGLAQALIASNECGWFRDDTRRISAMRQVFVETAQWLMDKLGPDWLDWSWGRLHRIEQKHLLSDRGDLGKLLDRGGVAVRGDFQTVCNTGQGVDFSAPSGAGYRMIADLSDPHGTLWAIDAGSESGCPGSPHYDDQLADWCRGEYHPVILGIKQLGLGETRLPDAELSEN